ncbi:MAG: 30S ribosomal protein S12 methylthiotransferase RimO [Ruminococcaceae bacterium]|jgi:ribosomal protein S12 methylthiotransferase|nr:30S ribosomal protein S12 methylthiotransferase RimO [Oscillospiraceae bacterium]
MRVGFISLGCAKNQVDCEQMMYRMREAGHEVLADPDGADLVVINTCGFIDAAKSEAIDHIIAMGELKRAGRIGKILVTGCLAQRYQEEILREMPEVDGVLGTGSYFDIASAARQVMEGQTVSEFGDIDAPVPETGRILTTPAHYAFLKIAEGCSNRCAFCVIPQLRGRYRSRPMDEVLCEARTLAAEGVKELIVVAQDTTLYGVDLPGHRKLLPELLRQLCRIEGVHWVRVHYLYPESITPELLDVFAGEPKLVNYLDIPIQHVNDGILKAMRRRGTRAYLEDLFRTIRAKLPDAVIRTSLIAGLPGEGEAEFEELCDFLREFRLERVGVFVYSPEEGTPAAEMPRPDEAVAVRRTDIVTELQSRIMDAYQAGLIGKTMEILSEGCDPERDLYFGRSYADSPEIDGKVWFTSENVVKTGSFVPVRIEKSIDGELYGAAAREEE